jgi:hypothetical protein
MAGHNIIPAFSPNEKTGKRIYTAHPGKSTACGLLSLVMNRKPLSGHLGILRHNAVEYGGVRRSMSSPFDHSSPKISGAEKNSSKLKLTPAKNRQFPTECWLTPRMNLSPIP